jgi:CRISPR-associated protein (TIGR02710 family)
MSFETAILLTAGTTPEPLKKCLEEARGEGELLVYILYGRPFPGQHPSPLENASEVRDFAIKMGFKVISLEVPDPEDLQECIRVCESAARSAIEQGANTIIANYTGGTKPMSSALVYTVLTKIPLGTRVYLEYIGGVARDKFGRVLHESMRTRREVETFQSEKVDEALSMAKSYRLMEALSILRDIEFKGRSAFIKDGLEALYLWDQFQYQDAEKKISGLKYTTEILRSEEKLAKLAETIYDLSKYARRLNHLVSKLQSLESKYREAIEDLTYDREGLGILSIDAYNNAERRLIEGRWIDASLRSYRAAEVAVQAVLISKYKINPWNPDWSLIEAQIQEQLRSRLDLQKLPGEIALGTGYALLEVLHGDLGISEPLKSLQTIRNHSFLEHGYQKISEKAASQSIEYSKKILTKLLSLIDITEEKINIITDKLKFKI